jgi:hypothetical protein
MPVIRDIPLNIEAGEILRREGLGGKVRVRPEVETIIRELVDSARATHLVEPLMAYEIYPITELTHDKVSLDGGREVSGTLLPPLLARADELAIAVITIGPALEKRVTEYNNNKEPLRAILLDGIGSAAVDSLTQEACAYISHQADSRGYQVGSPVNPGMPGLALTEQWPLLEMVPAGKIGVSLTSSGVMVPRKSTSMLIGIGKQMTVWSRAEVCERCNLGETCPYRIKV